MWNYTFEIQRSIRATTTCGNRGVLLSSGAQVGAMSAEKVGGRVSPVEVKEAKLRTSCRVKIGSARCASLRSLSHLLSPSIEASADTYVIMEIAKTLYPSLVSNDSPPDAAAPGSDLLGMTLSFLDKSRWLMTRALTSTKYQQTDPPFEATQVFEQITYDNYWNLDVEERHILRGEFKEALM